MKYNHNDNFIVSTLDVTPKGEAATLTYEGQAAELTPEQVEEERVKVRAIIAQAGAATN